MPNKFKNNLIVIEIRFYLFVSYNNFLLMTNKTSTQNAKFIIYRIAFKHIFLYNITNDKLNIKSYIYTK